MRALARVVLVLFALSSLACRSSAASSTKPLVCPGVAPEKGAASGNPAARRGAQRGLEYLARASEAWTAQHSCFGCHVQAVTLEALTVGKHHQYDVKKPDLEAMVHALQLGVTAGGHVTGTAFEGQAWARYDQWIDGQHSADLARYADELLTLQNQDGSVPDDDARLPVTGGTMHTTYQAMQTWRQAYARTADDKWLTPIRKAERYLAAQSGQWSATSDVYLQNVNFALLGLVAAGVGPSEASSLRLQRILLARQNQDGGWGLEKQKSDALATGQTLYALKLAGHTDAESAIARATTWLVKHQGDDGAWRTVRNGQGGAEKGEGMWAVLGLVSVDVMSVAVNGLVDGQHVSDAMELMIEARDNQAGAVSKVELFVDDLPLAGRCGDKLAYRWRTNALGEGKHLVDVVATNSRGAQSRRRFEVYAGHVLLTEIGTRFDERRQATDVTVRNIAASSAEAGRVELDIYSVQAKDNKRGKRIFTQEQAGAPGAMTFSWNGQGGDGAAQPRGRYLAELVLRDAKGNVVQREESLFFHDAEAVQKKQLGEIEGQLSLSGGDGLAANTAVELVDDKGNVLQRVQSTSQGNFRFKNVEAGKYRVRAAKKGWAPQEAPVTAAPAAPAAKANLHF
jgi:squalene-hopene/tetraprenyl-beta-curcumene cyclase